jgi:pyruvate dehydrogenase E2 component (dihydrolipoamide acetyltransferase)
VVAEPPAAAPVPEREPGERVRSSPLVRRLAAEHGIDLAQVNGSGPHGRIVKRDIEGMLTGAQPIPRAAEPAPTAAPAAQPTPAPAAAPQPALEPVPSIVGGELREFSRIRQTIGKRMQQSWNAAPHIFVSMSIDMGAAMALREQVNADLDEQSQLTVNDLVVKAVALALRNFPVLNSAYVDGKLELHERIDVGFAVAIEGGLISPFIPATDRASLGEIARKTKDLSRRAREGGLKPEEYAGGTFTTSNLGMFGVDDFTAIINPPQAAILAIGAAKQQPVWNPEAEAFEPQLLMKVTISVDHRLSDGAEAAQYLRELKRLLEHPMLLLVG